MSLNQELRTADDFLEWGADVMETGIAGRGLSFSEEARRYFLDAFRASANLAERRPRYIARYSSEIERTLTEQAEMAVNAARWAKSSTVRPGHLRQAIQAHRLIKVASPVCNLVEESAGDSERAAA